MKPCVTASQFPVRLTMADGATRVETTHNWNTAQRLYGPGVVSVECVRCGETVTP